MVEGHGCHRVAAAHRRLLQGHRFTATSPNGRFVDGAKAVNGQPLQRIEVHGKNLFYFFGSGEKEAVVHIHFGMSGAFRTGTLPGDDSTPTTRLELINEDLGVKAQLSAMTCVLGDQSYYAEKSAKLGPDPLREDADGELLWEKMKKSKKSIGLVLMDQSMVAGVGNIFRAEILFKAGVHPEQPAHSVPRADFEAIWQHTVLLLQRGYVEGSILTVDPEEAKVLGRPWTRRYIYNQRTCGRCGDSVRSWDMANRTVYACETCQPLKDGTKLSEDRAAAVADAVPVEGFKSHCAPDDPSDPVVPAKLTVKELRAELKRLQMPFDGNKPVLIERLTTALGVEAASDSLPKQEPDSSEPEQAMPTEAAAPKPGQDPQGSTPEPEQERPRGEKTPKQEPQESDARPDQEEDGSHAVRIATLSELRVPELKAILRAAGAPLSGNKADLVARAAGLAAAQATVGLPGGSEDGVTVGATGGVAATVDAPGVARDAAAHVDLTETGDEDDGGQAHGRIASESVGGGRANRRAGTGAPLVGTSQLPQPRSARAAALEKVVAGENRAVEHIAWHVDAALEGEATKPKDAMETCGKGEVDDESMPRGKGKGHKRKGGDGKVSRSRRSRLGMQQRKAR